MAESEENRTEEVDLLLEKGYVPGTEEFNNKLIDSLKFGIGIEEMEKFFLLH